MCSQCELSGIFFTVMLFSRRQSCSRWPGAFALLKERCPITKRLELYDTMIATEERRIISADRRAPHYSCSPLNGHPASNVAFSRRRACLPVLEHCTCTDLKRKGQKCKRDCRLQRLVRALHFYEAGPFFPWFIGQNRLQLQHRFYRVKGEELHIVRDYCRC